MKDFRSPAKEGKISKLCIKINNTTKAAPKYIPPPFITKAVFKRYSDNIEIN